MRDYFGRSIPEKVSHTFRRDVLAECLWEYGEEEIAMRALTCSEEELYEIQLIDLWNDRNLPECAARTNGQVMALSAVEFFEGGARALNRKRRRKRPPKEQFKNPEASTPAEKGASVPAYMPPRRIAPAGRWWRRLRHW